MNTSSEPRYIDSGSAMIPRAVIVAVLSFVLGGLTFYAQGFLPDAAVPFANSSSGWTLLTSLLVFGSRFRPAAAAVLGAVSFVLLVLGYAVVAGLEGLYYNPLLFSMIGVIAGPAVGAATSWLRARGFRAAAGTGVLAGIGLGDGLFGLTVVHETTEPGYWWAVVAIAVILLAVMLVRRIRGAGPAILAVAGSAAMAGAFLIVYQYVGARGLG
ncbi:DUF6518 family protein [Bogoriella caseilytica]|nr:DUF6518 family protein [Bogoriella caseilytica]